MTAPVTRLAGGLPGSYWKLWFASALSNLSDGIFWVALPLLAITLTDSPALVAGVTIASRLPWLLFALVAGALADRLDRRRTMILVNLFRAGLLGFLAVATAGGFASIPLIYGVAFVLGVAETLFDTSAMSILPNIVGRDLLSRANGRLYAIELTMNQFIGPPLGGFLAAYGIALAFGAESAAYLVAAVALLAIPGSFRPVREGPPTRIRDDIVEGLRYLASSRVLFALSLMVGVTNFSTSAIFSIFVLYAVAPGPLVLSEVGYGLLWAASAVGSVIGSVMVERLELALGRANVLAVSVVTTATMLAVPAFTTEPIVVGVSFAVSGVAMVVWNVVAVSLRQRITPDRLLGRVNASHRLLAWGTMPLGAAFGGILGELVGLRETFVIAALVVALLVVGRLVVTDPAIAAAEHAALSEEAA